MIIFEKLFLKKIGVKSKAGFSLMEILLYLSLASVLVLGISYFIIITLQARTKNQTVTEVEQSGEQAMQVMTQTIRNASSIISPSTNNTSYGYRKQLTIDYTKVSGGADLSNFPVLISYTDANLKTVGNGGHVTNSNGYDIIFRANDGTTVLDHEIESYNASTGAIVMWVRIPTLSYTADTSIYVYYGNSSITTSQENITGVWNVNYAGIWHLKEDPSGGAPQMKDSTASGLNGTSNGTMVSGNSVSAQIGSGLDFDGVDDYINVGNGNLNITGNITVEMWTKNDVTPAQWDALLVKASDVNWTNGYGLFYNSSTQVRFYVANYTANVASSTISPTAQWNHVVGVYDGANVHVYVNGVDGTTDTYAGVVTSNSASARIAQGGSNTYNINGKVDEVRISNTARSAGWIVTEYNNHVNQGTGAGKFVKTLGGEETL